MKVENSSAVQVSPFARSALSLPSAAGIAQFAIGGVLFLLLATANGAGYRYGASDQAFYIPAVARALDPAVFPRDAALIDAEGRLMVIDDMLAGIVRSTGLSLEAVFLCGYIVAVAVIWAALALIGAQVYQNKWAMIALAAAFSMRHRIPRTSANSFEPYFHPRMLAFGIGALAVAALLRRRQWLAVGLVGAAAIIHVTTALWFAILLGVALVVIDARWRRLAVAATAAALLLLAAAATVGPMPDALTVMDATWLNAVASKDSLFATDWPAWAWASNLGFLALLWWAHRARARRGTASAEDGALVWGAAALVTVFLITLPLVAMKISMFVQFQISRVFWLVDFLALIYVIAALSESAPGEAPRARLRSSLRNASVALACVLVGVAATRAVYVMLVERPERALFATVIPDSPWENAMRWIAGRPSDIHVLADPGHAWKYGTSVRVSARRDVWIEEVKDSAVAIYSRAVATRLVERSAAVGDFPALTADRAAVLANQYDLDYLITESDLPLPVAYSNQQFRIYTLR
jgi:hypothetical protein